MTEAAQSAARVESLTARQKVSDDLNASCHLFFIVAWIFNLYPKDITSFLGEGRKLHFGFYPNFIDGHKRMKLPDGK